MPDSTGKTGRGVSFALGDGQTPTEGFMTIANATSINPSGRDAEEVDFTHLLSTGGFREFRQGFKDGGSISVDYHFSPDEDSHQELLDLWVSGEVFNWRIDFSGAGWDWYMTGKGYVQNPGDITIDVDNPVQGSCTVRVTGAPSFVEIP